MGTKIKFNSKPVNGDFIQFERYSSNVGGSLGAVYTFTYDSNYYPNRPLQTLSIHAGSLGQQAVQTIDQIVADFPVFVGDAYLDYFDQNSPGYFHIDSIYPEEELFNFVFSSNFAEVENPISISNVVFSEAVTNKCQKVSATITTSELATKIISPFQLNGNTENPFTFEWVRGQIITLEVENSSGGKGTKSITFPNALNAANFTIQVNNSPNGASVIVNSTLINGLVLQYSKDGINWQTSNVFSGIQAGSHKIYVKDQYGCSFEKDYLVDELGITEPFFYISKSNSIRFAERVTFGNSSNYKNDENTLSCEVDAKLPYMEIQPFQTSDLITTQFKSNYKNISAKLIKSDNSEIDLIVERKSNNIGIKDKRDAFKYSIGGGQSGIYFSAGNKYDYSTDAVTEPYSLNGLLPEWAQIGSYFSINNVWHKIDQIVFDENKSADVIVFPDNYTGIDTPIIVGAIYNRFEYEVYEFQVDMSLYENEYFRVKIINSDPNFGTKTHLSEKIYCLDRHKNTLEIRYINSSNTDIFYSTGIEHLIRVFYTNIKGKTEEESETYKTDTNAKLLNADLFEVDDFIFEPLTKEMWRKLAQALSHEKVTIDGVGYVKSGNFNTEGPLNDSNLYVLTATMIKTGNVYNSKTAGGSIELVDDAIEVPNLITTNSGFISY
jgi:Icc-related predicted phosphoesterase